ncbi:hypothetical protein JOD64_002995 [Micromonospora luteifusca]|uniref:Uncharacterized protein n=1 Tax=Micromonospora luteifusca TaxID=709860 RepID=A0ABS2LUA6_9ACTN|nr:hypothetical protein [Micromonospora luteifusca]MBM7491773.1 hypothetical protein [Micromonospora luteifusca]
MDTDHAAVTTGRPVPAEGWRAGTITWLVHRTPLVVGRWRTWMDAASQKAGI